MSKDVFSKDSYLEEYNDTDYSQYIDEKLDENISYSEYLAEQIDNTISYSDYLASAISHNSPISVEDIINDIMKDVDRLDIKDVISLLSDLKKKID